MLPKLSIEDWITVQNNHAQEDMKTRDRIKELETGAIDHSEKRLRKVFNEARNLRQQNLYIEFELIDPGKLWDLIDEVDRIEGRKT